MTLVIDASVVVAALIDGGNDGSWADRLLGSEPLAAPHLLPAEVTNVLRRCEAAGTVTADVAALALHDLGRLQISYVPFEVARDRVWELRANLTAYDAWYVAIAELLEAPLATLDRRLVASPGPRCQFVQPEGASPAVGIMSSDD